jgi:hypothetical protein
MMEAMRSEKITIQWNDRSLFTNSKPKEAHDMTNKSHSPTGEELHAEIAAWEKEIDEQIDKTQTIEDFIEFLDWFEAHIEEEEAGDRPNLPAFGFIRGMQSTLIYGAEPPIKDPVTGRLPEKPNWSWLARLFVTSYHEA